MNTDTSIGTDMGTEADPGTSPYTHRDKREHPHRRTGMKSKSTGTTKTTTGITAITQHARTITSTGTHTTSQEETPATP